MLRKWYISEVNVDGEYLVNMCEMGLFLANTFQNNFIHKYVWVAKWRSLMDACVKEGSHEEHVRLWK